MFHDVYVVDEDESGYIGKGPGLYKLSQDKFVEIINILSSQKDIKFQYTFDDGGISAYTLIAPLLEKHGLRGCFFLVTSKINTPGFLTSEQILSLDRRGHIIGSHSHSHPRLTELSPTEIQYEWLTSKKILEDILGHTVSVVSIPNGYQSKKIFKLATQSGYNEIYTSIPQVICSEGFQKNVQIGRFVVLRDSTTNDILRLNKVFYRVCLYGRYLILSFLRNLLGPLYKIIRNKIIK